ncbi:hypothetical protein Q5752_002318 [Cryptotrichosporon argae]
MAFKNTYVAPTSSVPVDAHKDTPANDYDFNFMYEVKTLRSDRVEMRPFVPSLHAQALFDGIQANPEILHWLGTPQWQTLSDCLYWVENTCRRTPGHLQYAIYSAPLDRLDAPAADYVFAGTLGLIESSVEHMISEPGWILIMKPFQRTHVLTHAAGLATHRILDAPQDGGLGLRRCQWQTTTLNTASQAAARRLGYTHEGVLRGLKVLAPGKVGVRDGRPGVRLADHMQRDSWVASVMWYEWEESVRAHVDALMARRG